MKRFLFLTLLLSLNVRANIFVQQKIVLDSYTKNEFYYTNDAAISGIKIELSKDESNQIKSIQMREEFLISLKCDEDVEVKSQFKKLFGNDLSFRLYRGNTSDSAEIKIATSARCALTSQNMSKKQTIKVLPFSNISNVFETLENDKNTSLDGNVTLLDRPELALNERVNLLLGYKLSKEDLEARNPFMKLDFSQMPKFDLIVLSSLQMNNDFVCNVIFRILAEHAKRGTPVVLLFSEVLTGPKEKALLSWLESQSTNVKSIQYKYESEDKTLSGFINSKHRVNHAKFLATYSASEEKNNVVIAGGRNMSDRYFFRENKDFSFNKNLTQYNHELANPWVYFHDLDFKIMNKNEVIKIISDALTFMKIKSLPLEDNSQFILSVPFLDGRKLEERFVKEILSAKSSINILSPYIYLSPAILAALKTANQENHVTINIILSDSLFGDATTTKLKELYDEFASDYLTFVNVYHYTDLKKGIMHRKAVLIDDEKLILGSVNLSRRSFTHDTESAFFFTDKNVIEEFNDLFANMFKGSDILLKHKTKVLNKMISKRALELIDEEII